MTALSTVLTVLVLKLFYMPGDVAMPGWFHNILFNCLGKVTGHRRLQQKCTEQSVDGEIAGAAPRDTIANNNLSGESTFPKNVLLTECPTKEDEGRKRWIAAARIIDKFVLYAFAITLLANDIVCLVLITKVQ